MNKFRINHLLESFLIITHDLLVISPSYFVFEMESIRCIVKANTLEHFKKTRRRLIIESIVIASILVSFSTVAAFLNAFLEDHIGSDQPTSIKSLYLLGAVLQTTLYIPAIYVFCIYLISLNYFVTQKVNAIMVRQLQLSFKHRFFVIWCYTIGFLQLSTLLTRIYITIYTRYWLQPQRDTNTILIWALRLWITVVDWVTPFSLLYLYKHIGVTKMADEKTLTSSHDSTVGVERIKMLLEQNETAAGQGRQLKSLKSGYTEVVVPDTNQKYSPSIRSKAQDQVKSPVQPRAADQAVETQGTLNRDSDEVLPQKNIMHKLFQ